MFKNYRDKIALSGITVLGVGVALLIFTFISTYGFLTQSLQIITSQDLVQTFGEALAPLIATCIRVMYLGVMGWIGSLITIRGVTIITNAPKLESLIPQKPMTSQPSPAPLESVSTHQKETAPSEPEMAVMPPEDAHQTKKTRNSTAHRESSD
ncbi:hypothetical protein A3K79_04245 [Candidatus Bathyarchaeota archaeon RBG_13_46_16b]|nr:MAG: hypothetical protein A3K79_04245 [Candidatus Bathyarchaeota archaeon RBG_13_46_16b]